MPRVKKSVARADIYRVGLRTENPANKQGYTLDRSKPADDNDTVIVQKGQTYYSWAFAYSPKQISLTYPKPQQLTRSEFQTTVYDFNDEIAGLDNVEDADELKETVEDIVQRIRDFAEEQDEKRNNMPDSLQESPTGELLQERYEALDSWANDLENVTIDDYDPEEVDPFDYDDPEEYDQAREDHLTEWIADKIEELQSITCDI